MILSAAQTSYSNLLALVAVRLYNIRCGVLHVLVVEMEPARVVLYPLGRDRPAA